MVWIGVGPCLDRPRSEPQCVCMLQLGWTMKRKRKLCRQQVYGLAAAPPYNLQPCPLGSFTAWRSNNCSLAVALLRFTTSAASKFDSLAAWLYNNLSWPLGMANRCKPPNPKTCNHHWTTHQLTNTLYRSEN